MPESRGAKARARAERDSQVRSPSDERTEQLIAANEQLVLAILRAQAAHDAATALLTQMTRTAERDTLTALPNRLLMRDRCTQAIAQARRHQTKLAVLFVDLNDFKLINDRLGHAVGDEVLKLVAKCFGDAIRASDTVSRHGGDEFLILLADLASVADALHAAHKVVTALEAPSCVGPHALSLTASIGVSIFPDDGDDVDTLIERADAAMYHAKRHGPGSHVYRGDSLARAPHT